MFADRLAAAVRRRTAAASRVLELVEEHGRAVRQHGGGALHDACRRSGARRSPVPSADCRNSTPGTPPVCDVNEQAMRPSGIQTGPWSSPGSVVTRVIVSRARSHTQMSLSSSSISSATRVPSGDSRDLGVWSRWQRRAIGSSWPCRSTQTSVRGVVQLPPRSRRPACRRRDVELGRAGRQRHDLLGTTTRPCRASRARVEVEGDGPQRAAGDVDEMTARHVLGLTAAAQHGLPACPIAQIQHRDLRRVHAARDGDDREEDGLAAGQYLRPQVIGFRHGRGRARSAPRARRRRRDPQQPGRRRRGGDDDRVVVAPRGAAAGAIEAADVRPGVRR